MDLCDRDLERIAIEDEQVGEHSLLETVSLNTLLERSGTAWLVGVGLVLLFATTNALGDPGSMAGWKSL